jgi:hypothetical protein
MKDSRIRPWLVIGEQLENEYGDQLKDSDGYPLITVRAAKGIDANFLDERRKQIGKSASGERWITIGSEPGVDGKNHGGYPVKIDGDGRMLTGKFAGKTFDEAFEEPKKKRHFSRREDGTPTHTTKGEVFTVPTEAMYVDPARFQYKIKNIGADGVTAELKDTKVWNPELGGVLLVWRDPETGKDYVVNGHHRRELAGRSKAPELNVRYIDAPNHVEARARGALANIAEGRGTALDAAKFMRDSKKTPEQLKEAGVSMSGKVAADAAVLVWLNDKSFQALTQGMLDEDKAVAVAKYLPDQALQQKLFKKLETREEDGKEWSIKEIETAARKMANAGKLVTQGTDLFGDFESEDSTFDQEVEIEAYVRRQLAQDANDFKAVASERRAERVASAGNVLATDENASRHQAAEVAASEFDRESGLKGPVTATIQEFAAKLAKATKKSEKAAVKQEAYDALRKVIGVQEDIKKSFPKDGDGDGKIFDGTSREQSVKKYFGLPKEVYEFVKDDDVNTLDEFRIEAKRILDFWDSAPQHRKPAYVPHLKRLSGDSSESVKGIKTHREQSIDHSGSVSFESEYLKRLSRSILDE